MIKTLFCHAYKLTFVKVHSYSRIGYIYWIQKRTFDFYYIFSLKFFFFTVQFTCWCFQWRRHKCFTNISRFKLFKDIRKNKSLILKIARYAFRIFTLILILRVLFGIYRIGILSRMWVMTRKKERCAWFLCNLLTNQTKINALFVCW